MILIILNIVSAIVSLIFAISNAIKDDFKWAIIFTLCFALNITSLVLNSNEFNQNDNIEISQPTAKDVYD